MGNAVQDLAPTRQAQPPELPSWGPGEAAPLPRAPLLPRPLRTGVVHPPFVPGTVGFPPRSSPSNCSGSLEGTPRAAAPTPTPPALGHPAPLGMLSGTQASPTHPAASPGSQRCPGMGRFNDIPKFSLDSCSRAREQIREFTVAVFLEVPHACAARSLLFSCFLDAHCSSAQTLLHHLGHGQLFCQLEGCPEQNHQL